MKAVDERDRPTPETVSTDAGMTKLVLHVSAEDAVLLSRAVDSLRDPHRRDRLRQVLGARGEEGPAALKAHLEDAPLDGIDLSRPTDGGRDRFR